MLSASVRIAFVMGVGFAAAMLQTGRGCGYSPPDRMQLGEPCTRSSECEVGLACQGGACRSVTDGGGSNIDAGSEPASEAGAPAADAATPADGSSPSDRGSIQDGGPFPDGGDLDAGDPDADVSETSDGG